MALFSWFFRKSPAKSVPGSDSSGLSRMEPTRPVHASRGRHPEAAPVGDLGVGKQQLVEIAKALSKEVRLLILDEPTASLNEADSDALLDLLLEFKAQGAPRNRVVSLFVDDPSADLFGNEPVLADGRWVGYVRAAAYGYTLGGPVGLAQVFHDGGVTAAWLREQSFTVHTPGGDYPARLQFQPFYDPDRTRILDT